MRFEWTGRGRSAWQGTRNPDGVQSFVVASYPPVVRFASNRGQMTRNPYGVQATRNTMPVREFGRDGEMTPNPDGVQVPRTSLPLNALEHDVQMALHPVGVQVCVSQLSSLAMARRACVSLAPGCPAGATGGCEKQRSMNPVGVPGSLRGVA